MLDVDALLASGWRFGSVPWTKRQTWDELMDFLGDDCKVLGTLFNGNIRGTVLISPEGARKMEAYMAGEM